MDLTAIKKKKLSSFFHALSTLSINTKSQVQVSQESTFLSARFFKISSTYGSLDTLSLSNAMTSTQTFLEESL